MKKVPIKIEVSLQQFKLIVENRFWRWVFHRIFTVMVMPPKKVDELTSDKAGRVTKVTGSPQFNANKPKGGRIVKAMPRSLKKIKEGQESTGEVA